MCPCNSLEIQGLVLSLFFGIKSCLEATFLFSLFPLFFSLLFLPPFPTLLWAGVRKVLTPTYTPTDFPTITHITSSSVLVQLSKLHTGVKISRKEP